MSQSVSADGPHGQLTELRAANAYLAGILDIAEDAIVSVNGRQEIVLFNRGAEKTFGYQAADVLGKPLDMLIPERYGVTHRRDVDEFGRGPASARRMGERSEVYGRRADGGEFPADVTISKVSLDGDLFFTAIVRDITARKQIEAELLHLNRDLERRVENRTAELAEGNRRLETALTDLRAKTDELRATTQQLWQSAKLAGVGELAASIAHELNNPLGIATLRLESLMAQTPPDDPRRRVMEIVEQELERMAALVSNLLQFIRFGHDQVSTVDVRDEIERTLELVFHHLRKRGVTVRTEFAPAVPLIYADRQKLRQVFLNLFTNAGDAMPAGGTLTIRAKPGTGRGGADAVVIEVADSGVGIAPEVLPKVMDAFFTTKEEGKGTGLGLAICRRIAHEHDGTIEIESDVGRGTVVWVTIPVNPGGHAPHLRDSQ
jgi:PAS domain S-box-containing protein